MGRPLEEARTNKGTSAKQYNVFYNYNLDGSLYQLTYPSSYVVTYTPGGAGRPLGLSDSANDYVANGTGATRATYAPNGALTGMINGYSSQFAGIVTSNSFTSRGQPGVISASAPPSGTFMSLTYDFHLGKGDNGNVFQVIDSYDATRSTAYSYDLLNRLQQANTLNTSGANCWGETYAIDAWSNLYNVAGVSGMGTCTTETLAATATTQNQLNGLGMTYDAAGNVTKDNLGNKPTYDQENRIATVAGYTYNYDADGVRMEKAAGSTGTMYWTGPGGATLTETDLTGTINEEYIFFNGERLARVDRPSGTVHYYFSDHLGSASKIVGIVGSSAVLQEQYYYYPYGGTQSQIGSDPNHYKFTGKERDNESSLDNFGARYYGFTMGRFLTPDWAARPTSVPYAVFGDPQSLNLYGYVRNDPVSRVDPDGHCYYGHCTDAGYLIDAMGAAVYASDTGSGTIPSGWVSQEYLDLLASSTPSARKPHSHKPKKPGTKLQRQIYRETSGLRGPRLHAARVAIAQTRILNHSHEAIAKDFNPNKPADSRELNAITHNREAAAIFADVGKAISEATTAPNDTNGATHFVLNYGQDLSSQAWYAGGSIENSYGPFENTAGGDVPRAEDVDIEIVNFPPKF